MHAGVCVCMREEACLSRRVFVFFFFGAETDVQHKSLSHRDAVPPTRTCCCPLLQENCRQESPGVALNRQPLLQMLLDCMDCFRIKLSEVVLWDAQHSLAQERSSPGPSRYFDFGSG